ncbi:MAG: hypothetical protein Fur005_42420 [Roseiflexaceae bacterium]
MLQLHCAACSMTDAMRGVPVVGITLQRRAGQAPARSRRVFLWIGKSMGCGFFSTEQFQVCPSQAQIVPKPPQDWQVLVL